MSESYTPPFNITNRILNQVSEISELVTLAKIQTGNSVNLKLRKANRIKTVYSSLAIEQNSLTLDQVTAILSGKHILAPQKDVTEIKNAYQIYDSLDSLDPFKIDGLLFAHRIMMKELAYEAGQFRSNPVGVVDRDGHVIHIGTLPAYVPDAVNNLFEWIKNSDMPMLIKSCVFHYEFELIHPFSDGNGRIGRLWHTLLLSKWNSLFLWLPVESIIHSHQAEYYKAINNSNTAGESSEFIEFMLDVIMETLKNTINAGKKDRLEIIMEHLSKKTVISNKDIQKLFGVSSATSNRLLNKLLSEGKIVRIRQGSFWAYKKANR